MANSPDITESASDEMRMEYDFRSMAGVVRGKYSGRPKETGRFVKLADDVAAAFKDEEAVNQALRDFLKIRDNNLGG